MNQLDVNAIKRVVPEMMELLKERVRIMQRIMLAQPIGRRALAGEMKLTERVLRKELDFLREQGLISATPAGVYLSEDGQSALGELEDAVSVVEGRAELAERLSRRLRIPTVIVVEGNLDETPWVKEHLGRKAAVYLQHALEENDVVAVTGGTTIASVAAHMPNRVISEKIRVVPARGGVGERVDIQANTVASMLAERIGGTSIMLHVPDRIGEETLEQLLSDPYVNQRLQEIRKSTVVVHGIGGAISMANRRKMPEEEISILEARGAVAEAFGYNFRADGQVVYAMTTVGLRLDDLKCMRLVMAVAGGQQKSAAIRATASAYRIDVLVTDEGAATAILEQGLVENGQDKSKE
jgi:central glycolytic genes regulator